MLIYIWKNKFIRLHINICTIVNLFRLIFHVFRLIFNCLPVSLLGYLDVHTIHICGSRNISFDHILLNCISSLFSSTVMKFIELSPKTFSNLRSPVYSRRYTEFFNTDVSFFKTVRYVCIRHLYRDLITLNYIVFHCPCHMN